jgi:hypothetical protein
LERTSDKAVVEAFGAAHSRLEDGRLARRAFHCAERRRGIVTTAGIDIDNLSEHGRGILDRLACRGELAIDGVVERASATWVTATGSVPDRAHRRPASRLLDSDLRNGTDGRRA